MTRRVTLLPFGRSSDWTVNTPTFTRLSSLSAAPIAPVLKLSTVNSTGSHSIPPITDFG